MIASNTISAPAKMFRAVRAAFIATALVSGGLASFAKDDPWLRVVTPEFTLVTALTEKEAVAWAGEFSQYIAELRKLFKITQPLPPLTAVVFARDRAFADYRPLDESGKPQAVAGFFLRHHSWAVAGLAGASAPEEVRRVIFHEGVHWFLSALDQPSPVWVEEGLAEVFSTFAVRKKNVEWGQSIPEHVQLLRDEKMLSVDRLLYLGRSELFRDTSSHTGIIYAQSWMVVHFLIFGDNKDIPPKALFDFLKLIREGAPIEEAFRRAVGSDLATFDRRLKDYMRSGRYYIHRQPLVALTPLRAEPAPPVEVAQALGRLAVAGRRWDKAIAFAGEAITASPEDPRGFELLGLARRGSGDETGGLEALAAAAAKGSVDFQTYFELAARAQQAAVNDSGGFFEAKPAEARRIADGYERAIELSPRHLPAYQNLAVVVGLAERSPRDRELLELGRKIFPGDGWIRIGLAVLSERDGDRMAALKVVDEIEADAGEPGRVRIYARNLATSWKHAEVTGQIESIVREEKFSEAVAYVEEQLAGPLHPSLRNQLGSMRPGLKASARSREIGAALKEQRWDDARRLLAETIASPDMPGELKRQSQTTLDDLNRRTTVRRPAKQ